MGFEVVLSGELKRQLSKTDPLRAEPLHYHSSPACIVRTFNLSLI